MEDTDATARIYFTALYRYAFEAFQKCFYEGGFDIGKLVKSSSYLLPIVHSKADYFLPLCLGDPVEVRLTVGKISEKSFTLCSQIYSDGRLCGTVTIIHAAIDKSTQTSRPLPAELCPFLKSLEDDGEQMLGKELAKGS